MRIDRFGLQDTAPEVQERVYDLLRQKTPEQRFLMVLQRMAFTRELRKATEHLREVESHGRTCSDDRPVL